MYIHAISYVRHVMYNEWKAFLADLIGRKFLGAKKRTQVDMNVYFQGVRWNLAERYTDVVSMQT